MAGDQQIQLDGPVEKNGERTFVPLSFISKVMGASVKWDNPSRTANITPVK
ncbi:stalk domain-containing protein [Paenibacillus sp. UNC217MF]|uniref:stalk domain-containing protein n=1 Tax=Paenibacillus sp. UNC217MF TaxID=1449062 RepID=UPI003FA77214